MNDIFWVTIVPARENAGTFQVDSQVVGMPDDVEFMTLYSTDSMGKALGFYDACLEALPMCDMEGLEWLDNINQCLFLGDLAKVTLYRVNTDFLTVKVFSETTLIVGSSVA